MFLPAIVVVSMLWPLFYHISVDYCLHSMVCSSTYFCNHVIYTFVMVSHQRNVCRNCGLSVTKAKISVFILLLFLILHKKKLTFKIIFNLKTFYLKKNNKSFILGARWLIWDWGAKSWSIWLTVVPSSKCFLFLNTPDKWAKGNT